MAKENPQDLTTARKYQYTWQAAYIAALDEPDKTLLQERINTAAVAIEARLLALNGVHNPGREQQALRDALFFLNLLNDSSAKDLIPHQPSAGAKYPNYR